MKRFACAVLFSFVLLTPLAAQTRTMPAELRDGRRALSFGAFVGGGGVVGMTFMMSPRTAFTLDVQLDGSIMSGEHEGGGVIVSESDRLAFEALLAPGFRRYMAGRGDVASYIAGRLLLGVEGSVNESRSASTAVRVEHLSPSAGAALGFGLEWFVTDAMSLRGEVAMEGTYTADRDSGPDPDGDEEFRAETIRAGLGQSGLAISIWF